MHDKKGEILFLGKSTNIKKRVNQHFTKDGSKARQLQKETKKITFERTGSELVGLLKENEELKKTHPKYNINKRPKQLYALYLCVNDQGYQYFNIAVKKKNKKSITTFSSRVGALNFLKKITTDYQLCKKVGDFPITQTPCDAYIKGNCLGACIGKENVASYNSRINSVIDKFSLAHKNILITDKGREVGEYTAILIRDGIFKGVGYYDLNHQINNIHILESIITPMHSDDHTIYIIESYLRNNRVNKIIDLTNTI